MILNDLSYRYKIPLRSTVLILVTAAAVATALIYRAADDLRSDMIESAEAMSRVLARTLEPALRRDDLWTAYEIITSPFDDKPEPGHAVRPESIVVLDERQNVYAASDPRRFPTLAPLGGTGHPWQAIRRMATLHHLRSPVLVTDDEGRMHMITPVLADGIAVGTLVVTYPGDAFKPRFISFAQRAGAITALVLVALLPMSWYWAVRMAQPLVQLADCLGKIGPDIPENLSCRLVESRDELGRAAGQFQRMLKELKEKQAIERRMIAAERLAAVGRLTAGIAHEINNPLGGMLNALNTFRRYGSPDEMTERTVSLLERGLLSIRETVSALLVEAKPEGRRLSHEDLNDVRTLMGPSFQKKSAVVSWEDRIADPLPVSATLVRQLLINLVLNAAHAVPPGGRIEVSAVPEEGELRIVVSNDGDPIPTERMAHLFEPFAGGQPDGTGLGLWVSYQIVQQLGGRIAVTSEPERTRFTVRLPIVAV